MASQEHLRMLNDDDDDSSTSTSSSTTSAASSDSDIRRPKASGLSVASNNTNNHSAPGDDNDADSDSDDGESRSSANGPLGTSSVRPMSVAPPTGGSSVDGARASSKTPSKPKPKTKPSSTASDASASGGPMKKRIKLTLKKSPSSPVPSKEGVKGLSPSTALLKASQLAKKRKASSSPSGDGTAATKKKKTKMVLPLRRKGASSGGSSPSTTTVKKVKKSGSKSSVPRSAADNSTGEIKAMVVGSDDEDGVDDVVVAVVEESDSVKKPTKPVLAPTVIKKKAPSPTSVAASILPTLIPTPVLPTRPIRLPSMSSPGLLLPAATAAVQRETVKDSLNNKDKENSVWASPASIFDHVMSLAGYVEENRVHRGSSVTRGVGDMFDADVKLALHPPQLVPVGLLHSKVIPAVPGMKTAENNTTIEDHPSEAHGETVSKMLLDALGPGINQQPSSQSPNTTNKDEQMSMDSESTEQSRKPRARRKLLRFADMAPVSLTIPYPESYIERHLDYVTKVQEREKAIVKFQSSCDELDEKIFNDPETYLDAAVQAKARQALSVELKTLPTIPRPPSPPQIQEMEGIDKEHYEDEHPYYIPKAVTSKEKYVSHLDKRCFHITQGRYFGPLTTNRIADPHFCGPIAPGIVGLNTSVANGLATAYSGGASASAASASVLVTTSGGGATSKSGANGGSVKLGGAGSGSGASTSKSKPKPSTKPAKASNGQHTTAVENGGKALSTSVPPKKKPPPSTNNTSADSGTTKKSKKNAGPTPTATLSDYRKAMDADSEMGAKLKDAMIRAAVHGSRNNQHSQSFRAPDGNVYPDVSKAFAAFAGLKPCARCKSNKQGAYHCRLRRKHKELDFDGNNSVTIIAPYFELPMDELLYEPAGDDG